jgi:hypothetical protein
MMAAPELEARIAELIENLFNLDRDRTGELLALLAQCRASHVARIFDCLPDPALLATVPNGTVDVPNGTPERRRPWVWTRYWEH